MTNPMMKEKRTMKDEVRTTEDIYSYAKQALDLLEMRRVQGYINDSNYNECKQLLTEQVNDELSTYYLTD